MANSLPTAVDRPSLAVSAAIGACVGLAIGGAYVAGALSRAAVDDAQARLVAGAIAPRPTSLRATPLGPTGLAPVTARPPALRLAEAAAPPAPVHLGLRGPAAPAHDLECLSQAVYYEARGEEERGRLAVAQVVINRLRHPHFPKSICGVVFQHADTGCAFSFACDGQTRHPLEVLAWRDARRVAQRALAGFVVPEVGSATDFRGGRGGAPLGLARVAQIGGHVFYRLTGRTPHPAPPRTQGLDETPAPRPVVIKADAPVKPDAPAATPAA